MWTVLPSPLSIVCRGGVAARLANRAFIFFSSIELAVCVSPRVHNNVVYPLLLLHRRSRLHAHDAPPAPRCDYVPPSWRSGSPERPSLLSCSRLAFPPPLSKCNGPSAPQGRGTPHGNNPPHSRAVAVVLPFLGRPGTIALLIRQQPASDWLDHEPKPAPQLLMRTILLGKKILLPASSDCIGYAAPASCFPLISINIRLHDRSLRPCPGVLATSFEIFCSSSLRLPWRTSRHQVSLHAANGC